MIFVVGSGPAGVACAHALVGRGCAVTMLDAGVEMEPDLRRTVDALGGRPPAQWDAGSLARIKQPTEASDRAIPLKASYGSLFPYRNAAAHLSFETHGVDAAPSFAKGGFSNVWGGTVLPYHPRDLAAWPIGADELAPHYAVAAALMRISEGPDRLAADFPLLTEGPRPLQPSRQAAALMADLESQAAALEADGVRFGYSRLAVRADPAGADGCVYCGLCLYGCPYGFIYNSTTTLEDLKRLEGFTYRPDVVVTKVEESAGGVRIQAEARSTREPLTFEGDRVLLAAGVFNTTAIVLASIDAYDTPVSILDSRLFLVPTLRYRGVRSVVSEPLFSLSQIFVELVQPSLSEHTVFLQVYSYNDWYVEAIKRRLGSLFALARPWIDSVLGRLIVFQGYLPSDLSPSITATLRRSAQGSTLVLEAKDNEASASAVAHVVGTLRRHRRAIRAVPMTPLIEIGGPGRGYHTGGSFPMRTTPGRLDSDQLGRPCGFTRIHAVDATVFPTIPAGPITFSVMANAHRIGVACAAL